MLKVAKVSVLNDLGAVSRTHTLAYIWNHIADHWDPGHSHGTKPQRYAQYRLSLSLLNPSFHLALGNTVSDIDLSILGPLHLGTISKSLFSMVTPELQTALQEHNIQSVIITGIEVILSLYFITNSLTGPLFQCHICVLISALDLLSLGYDVHILADGVSSSNKEEIPLALERMRQAGACIGTSESVAFQLQRRFSSITKLNYH